MSAYVNTDNFAPRPAFPPKARRIGKVVYWTGYVYCTSDVGGPGAPIMKNLPEWVLSGEEFSRGFVTYDTYNYGIMYTFDKTINIGQSTDIKSVGDKDWQGYSLGTVSGYILKGE